MGSIVKFNFQPVDWNHAMRLDMLLAAADPQIDFADTKIHLAVHGGGEDPLDVFHRGEFDDWQAAQNRRNFERAHVLALISFRGTDRWLFAGVYDRHGMASFPGRKGFKYDLTLRPATADLAGRLVVRFPRPGRQSYLRAPRWLESIKVHELLSERSTVEDFPGYRKVDISHANLKAIVDRVPPSWKAALTSVAGVYVITDTSTGKLYVGSASGEGGIWRRFESYVRTGHGGNRELRILHQSSRGEQANFFRYAILEIADVATSENDILQREAHWKRVLMTREFGLNAN